MVKVSAEEFKLIETIEAKVCRFWGINPQLIVDNNRTYEASLARGFVFYILHKEYNMSVSKIANTYCRTTRAVFWHVGKIKQLLKQRVYKEIYHSICIKENK